jgi:hypothetical protein
MASAPTIPGSMDTARRKSRFVIHDVHNPREPGRKGQRNIYGAVIQMRDPSGRTRTWNIGDMGQVQRAFLARSIEAITRIVETDSKAVAVALEAPTDVGTLAYVVSAAAATSAIAQLDPEAALLAEGAKLKSDLLERAGGTLGVGQVAGLLRVSRQAVDKRRKAGKLIAVPAGQDYVYPACQFTDEGIVPGLDKSLEAMPIRDPWMRLEWLLTEDDALEGMSPLAALKSGAIRQVVELAAGHGGD